MQEIIRPKRFMQPAMDKLASWYNSSFGKPGHLVNDKYNELNKDCDNFNFTQRGKRRLEIRTSDLKDCYVGDFMGMQVLEGEIVLRDFRGNIDNYLSKINVRLILGREVELPDFVNQNHAEYSDTNASIFAALVFEAVSQTTDGETDIESTKMRGFFGQENIALAAIVDQYKKVNSDKENYPLTIIYAEGFVENDEHVLMSGKMECHPTNKVLENLLQSYPSLEKEKFPVIIASSNETDKRIANISHPRLLIMYRKGKIMPNEYPTGIIALS